MEHSFDADHNRLHRELGYNIQGAKDPPVLCPILNGVTGLDKVRAFWPRPRPPRLTEKDVRSKK